jgi:hypothetical protein
VGLVPIIEGLDRFHFVARCKSQLAAPMSQDIAVLRLILNASAPQASTQPSDMEICEAIGRATNAFQRRRQVELVAPASALAASKGGFVETDLLAGLGVMLLAPLYGLALKGFFYEPLASMLDDGESALGSTPQDLEP